MTFPRLVGRAIREMSGPALDSALDAADAAGVSLATWIERRAEVIKAQLVRDAAPTALRELRRVAR